LNQALSTLRRILGRHSIITTDSSVTLVAKVNADFVELEKALEKDDQATARKLAGGRFLDDLSFVEAPAFTAWRDHKANTIYGKTHELYCKLISVAHVDDDLLSLEKLSMEAVACFPHDTPFRQQLISSKLRLDKLADARAAYNEWCEEASLTNRRESIPDWNEFAAILPKETPRTSVADRSFVGRRAELRFISDKWQRARAGAGSAILIRGKPGIGKTFLCNECLEVVRDARHFRGNAYEAEQTIGFALLANLLGNRLSLDDLRDVPPIMRLALQHLVPTLEVKPDGTVLPQLGHEASERRLFEAVTEMFIQMSRRHALLIVLDDIQWADQASAAWLHYFLRHINRERILILISCRLGSRTGFDAADIDQIALSEFTQIEVDALLRSLTRMAIETEVVREVFKTTAGHPLYAAQLASCLSGGLSLEIPQIQRQFDALPLADRRLVGLLAAAGVPMNPTDLGTLCGANTAEMYEKVRALPTLCTLREDGSVELSHDLVRTNIYSCLPESVRRSHHSQLAALFERHTETLGTAALHWSQAGNLDRTVDIALQAATLSESKHATSAAAYFYELCLSGLKDPYRRRVIESRLATLSFGSARFECALPLLRELSETASDEGESLDWRWKYLCSLLALPNTDARDITNEAIELQRRAESSKHAEALYHAIRAQVVIRVRSGHDDKIVQFRERLISISSEHAQSTIGARALRFAAEEIAVREDAQAGRSFAQTAYSWARKLGDTELCIECQRALAMAQYYCGDIQEARTTLNESLQLAESSGAALYRLMIMSRLICILTELDARSEAEQHLSRLLDMDVDRTEYVDGLANTAVLLLHHEEHSSCVRACDAALAAQQTGWWMALSLRGIRGLALLELGLIREALTEAHSLYEALNPPTILGGDISYAVMLIARASALRREEAKIQEFVLGKYEQYSKRDFVCRCRLQLALAEVVARRSRSQALSLAEDIIEKAEARGLLPLREQALATARRAKLKGGLRQQSLRS
jgi:hypothetical protein